MNMKYFLTAILVIVMFRSSAQTCTVSALQFKPNPKFFRTEGFSVSYPVVTVKDKKVSEKINAIIRSELIDAEFMELPLREAMNATLENGLVSMSYAVTFNRDGICSITVEAESCGAYCSGWSRYFNFDLNSGEAIGIDDLVKKDSLNILKDRVYSDKMTAIKKYKEELREALTRNETDSSTYDWAVGHVNGYCINTVRMDAYSLTDTGIEIKDRCEFPHAIQEQAPVYELNYSYKILEGFIAENYLIKLTGRD